MTYTPGSRRRTGAKLLLLVGFAALALAVSAAYRAPATAYELSIYAATPVTFWIGAYAALFVGLAVALLPDAARLRTGALFLGGSAVASIVALPILRGYYFYGTSDPLTHLGWAHDLSNGALDTFTFIYPGFHGLAVVLSRIGGYSIRRSVLVAVFLFAVVFVVFVAFTVRSVSGRAGALAIGAFSAFPLLPINNVSVHLRAHPFSQTTMFAAIVLFLLVQYVTERDGTSPAAGTARLPSVSPYGVLLVLSGGAAVLYHPQLAVDLLVVFGIVCAVQFLARWRGSGLPIADHRTMYVPTAIVAVVYAAWTLRTDWLYGAAGRHVGALLEYFGGGGVAGERIVSQGVSLAAIGVSLPEMFLKLFAVDLVYGLLAALLVLLVAARRVDRFDADTPELVTYLAAGGVGIAALIALYLVGSISEMYFRHLGVLSLIVAILGAVALLEVGAALPKWATPGRVRVAILVLFVLAVPLGLATAFQSPYIYKASPHVTEGAMEGHAFAFDQARVEDVPVIGVRSSAGRYSDAIHGTVESRAHRADGSWAYDRGVPDGELDALRGQVERGYVIVSTADRQREVVAYRGLRHGDAEFASLDAQVGVNRVHSSGETDLYLVG